MTLARWRGDKGSTDTGDGKARIVFAGRFGTVTAEETGKGAVRSRRVLPE